MIDKTKRLYEINKDDFNGEKTYLELSSGLDMLVKSIHKTVKEKFPEAFGMDDEEYKKLEPKIIKWLETKEAKSIHARYQLEALSFLTVKSMSFIHSIQNNVYLVDKIIDNEITRLMVIETDEKEIKSKD